MVKLAKNKHAGVCLINNGGVACKKLKIIK